MDNVIGGLKQEIDVSNFFAKLGYFTRFHIQLYPKEGKISDIDVFCIKFDNHLLPTRNIIETKRSSDKISVVFQLYGLKNFYENCNAFFVNDRFSNRTFEITSKLGVKVYSFDRLKKLSERDFTYPSIDITEKDGHVVINHLDVIKKIIHESLFWDYHYLWLEKNPLQKFNKIQEMFKITDDLYNQHSTNSVFLWFRKELFLMAFLAIMEIASKCIELDNESINEYIEDQFYNLGISKGKKLQLKEGVDSLLKIIQEKVDKEVNLKLEIIPNWLHILSKIIKTIVANANYANSYLLINEQILRSIIIGKPQNISSLSKSITKNILSPLNSDLLKILHKDYIFPDFNNFI